MNPYKIKKAVSKKAKKVKELIKTSSENINSKSYVDMIFQDGEKTVDSNTLIIKAQNRVLNSVKNGIEYPPFVDKSEEFLRNHVNSRVHIFVMYVDLVGSTNLTLSLPVEKIVTIVSSFAQEMAYTVTQFGGYMLKFVGDAVLAYFNAENELIYPADNIINCAKSMLKVITVGINPILTISGYPPLAAKIGIDHGQNIIVRYGSDIKKSHVDILGPSMNMAAKIQNMAEPNQLLIGEDVYNKLHPETQKSFKKKTFSETKWKYHHRVTGKLYPIYAYTIDEVSTESD
ncbi:MAG TPA: adenylate/guanylate cyclase domain-containing protein [Candidatus Nitrosopelagicus sp.]|nr:adenylate/guanylate cyclase domain-containing protein [Candidatus Nitrosopelagicus sp.]